MKKLKVVLTCMMWTRTITLHSPSESNFLEADKKRGEKKQQLSIFTLKTRNEFLFQEKKTNYKWRLEIEFSVKIGKHSLTSTKSKMDLNVTANFQKTVTWFSKPLERTFSIEKCRQFFHKMLKKIRNRLRSALLKQVSKMARVNLPSELPTLFSKILLNFQMLQMTWEDNIYTTFGFHHLLICLTQNS